MRAWPLLLLLCSCPVPEDCRDRSAAQVQDRYFACMLELEAQGYPDTDGEDWGSYCLEVARCR